MQPILSFINDDGLSRLDDRISDDYIASYGQAVHEDRVVRASHFLFVNNPPLTVLRPFVDVPLRIHVEAFTAPTLCVDHIRAIEGFIYIVRDRELRMFAKLPRKIFVELIT